MTRTLLTCCAPLAIAATVALPAIPAVAQDAVATEPVIVLPDPAPTAAPAPAIVLPDRVVDPAPVAATVATPQTERTTAAVAAPAQRRAAAAAPRAASTATVASSSARTAAVDAAPAIAPITPPVSTVDVAPAPVAAEPAVAGTDEANELALAGILGALGLVAVGGVALAASRRRRRRALDGTYDEVIYEPEGQPVAAAPVIAADPVVARSASPTFAASAPVSSAFTAPVVGKARPIRSPSRATGDPVALPAELPETFAERDALLKELVAAEPDKANPFTGVRARARRAKLIMQSLNRDFTSRKPRIDLSEYTNRWPALRGWQPATA